jgi:hypothetical protein
MSKFRTAVVSALTVLSLIAGGTALHAHSAPRAAHHVADNGCCNDEIIRVLG